ncbi:hypothetical protein [Streptomyces sp. NBC_00388]|uniref:hypothetical protein n=1 Tax=Streptomyces sp. NBC_00388 TaxID=2975735 RepID=UPI002E1C6B8F
MPALKGQYGTLAATAALGLLFLYASPAQADFGTGGGAAGKDLESHAGDSGKGGGGKHGVQYAPDNGPGNLTSVSDWSPPPCWFAPTYSPAEFQKEKEDVWNQESTGYQWDAVERDKYVNGHPYKDFNKAKAGKGYWWTAYVDETYPSGWDACYDRDDFWVDTGHAPPANRPDAITPKMLAELASAHTTVPDTQVTLAPAGGTKVNLPTWAWLDKAEFKPVSVTAYVPGVSATTTAKPVSLKLEPGTDDAELHPGSGECTFNADGSIGTPYKAGEASKTPPCGITYLRASGSNGPFKLRATITWNITWTGTGNPGQHSLGTGSFGTTQDVTVDEIQAINR